MACIQLPGLATHLSSFLTPEQVQTVVKGFGCTRRSSFRLNTLKRISPTLLQNVKNELGISKLEPCSFYNQAFLLPFDQFVAPTKIKEMKCVVDGDLYFQSLSSMLPALCLDARPGFRVLDMCAAPGGKTTLLACLMQNSGNLVSNEKSFVRFQKLSSLVNRLAGNNSCIQLLNEDGRNLSNLASPSGKHAQMKAAGKPKNVVLESFDRIIVDVPCSGMGRMTDKRPKSFMHWSLLDLQHYSKRQKQLLTRATYLLKPGGLLVYSTCTLSPDENEDVVQFALDNNPEVRLKHLSIAAHQPLPLLQVLHTAQPSSLALPGLVEYLGRKYTPEMSKTVRILPCESYEGFFVAAFERTSQQHDGVIV